MTRRPQLVRDAEVDDDGDVIYTTERPIGASGATKTIERNVTHLFQPGTRRTGSHDLLRREARLAADGVALANPAKPTDSDVAEAHSAWCDEHGIRPAWEVCDGGAWSP